MQIVSLVEPTSLSTERGILLPRKDPSKHTEAPGYEGHEIHTSTFCSEVTCFLHEHVPFVTSACDRYDNQNSRPFHFIMQLAPPTFAKEADIVAGSDSSTLLHSIRLASQEVGRARR